METVQNRDYNLQNLFVDVKQILPGQIARPGIVFIFGVLPSSMCLQILFPELSETLNRPFSVALLKKERHTVAAPFLFIAPPLDQRRRPRTRSSSRNRLIKSR